MRTESPAPFDAVSDCRESPDQLMVVIAPVGAEGVWSRPFPSKAHFSPLSQVATQPVSALANFDDLVIGRHSFNNQSTGCLCDGRIKDGPPPGSEDTCSTIRRVITAAQFAAVHVRCDLKVSGCGPSALVCGQMNNRGGVSKHQ